MKKRYIAGAVTAGVLLLGAVGSSTTKPSSSNQSLVKPVTSAPAKAAATVAAKPICDGSKVTVNCTVDGIDYKTYLYHPAEAEKSHVEQTISYKKEITSYCTLCGDGSYSPSCATGRGACSHHGGVAQWNAPRYSNVPVTTSTTVIDTAAKEAYYEKVTE